MNKTTSNLSESGSNESTNWWETALADLDEQLNASTSTEKDTEQGSRTAKSRTLQATFVPSKRVIQ